ncbi:MAG: outer membrane beta-barrel protein [Prolixibacteraceae bacterium]|nr:outer membrane beta-barrel protein [Prolixibacteraceae bacterium]
MKRLFILLLAVVFSTQLIAQPDTTKVKTKKNLVTVDDKGNGTHVKVGNENGIEVITDDWGDTTKVRIGRRTFKVVEDNRGTHINVEREWDRDKWTGHFNAHWAGIEWGMNTFQNTDYSMYNGFEFMDLNIAKSITVNLNFAEWTFRNNANNFALVTGAGFSFMDFAFDNPDLTIVKENGLIEPFYHGLANPKKSKLNVTYLTVPLMLELKTPFHLISTRVYIAGGVIGGLHLGSHTKYKNKHDKFKDQSTFNVNQFKYDLTARIGFGDFWIFANYSMVPLFETNKGPELYPLTIGVSFPNL